MSLPRLIRRALSMPHLFHFVGDRTGRFGHLLRLAVSMSPRVAAAKAARLVCRQVAERSRALRRRNENSYPAAAGAPERRLGPVDWSGLAAHAGILRPLAERACDHRFDLLGSGWVRVAPGEAYAGFADHVYKTPGPTAEPWRRAVTAQHGTGNRRRAAALLDLIDDPDYRPIDWHVDFKSGYRWSPATWGRAVAYGHRPGVDVKVPWELARLQHAPHLAYAARLATQGTAGFAPPERYRDEFRHQVLDFLAANPPGWGVNWACPMDVAIRAANLAMAWDLFGAAGLGFDPAFEAELAAALLAHGRHVVAHLEWHDQHRANHYLADLAGLAFIAAYLPRSPETDLWLAFAVQQIDIEIRRQFTPDGANFEASTAYHRLSSEMALHAVALVLGLPDERRAALRDFDHSLWPRPGVPGVAPGPMAWPPFAPETVERLAGMAGFAAAVTKPSGTIVQVGDNDSGRFLKLSPLYDPTPDGPAERILDLSGLIASAQGLFDLDLPTRPETAIEIAVVAALAGGRRLPVPDRCPATVPARPVDRGHGRRLRIVPPEPEALDGLEPLAFPDFGLFLWRNARSFIAVRCGPIGQNGNGGHAHNDQLAVEIEIDGTAWARDPGTGVYTPDLEMRNRYRSALAHFVPRHGRDEPAAFVSPFRLEDRARAEVLRFDPDFVGAHHGFGTAIHRRVAIEDGAVVVEDWPAVAIEHEIRSPAELARLWGLDLPFSPGYGLISR